MRRFFYQLSYLVDSHIRTAAQSSERGVRPAHDRRVAARQAGCRVQVDATGADEAEVRYRLDRLLHSVQEEGLRSPLGGGFHTDVAIDDIAHNAV